MRGHGAIDELPATRGGSRRSRAAERAASARYLAGCGLELLVALVAAENVDLAFVHDEIGGVASGGLAHPRAQSAELNLVSRGIALEGRLGVGSGEEVDEVPPRDAQGRFARDFLASDEKDRVEAVERVVGGFLRAVLARRVAPAESSTTRVVRIT